MTKKDDKIQYSIIEEIQESMILGDSLEDEGEKANNLPVFDYRGEGMPLQSHYLKTDLSRPKRSENPGMLTTGPFSADKKKLDSKGKKSTLITTRDIPEVV